MSFGDSLRKALDNELIEPDKGSYTVKLDSATAFESPKDGREFAKVTLEIVGGDNAGKRFEHWMRFGSEMQKQMSAEALAAYGVKLSEIENIEDIDDQLGALVEAGTEASVGVSYGGDQGQFLNVKVHGSRTTGVPDIPTDEPGEAVTAKPSSFAAAAGSKSDDGHTIPF